MKKIFILFLVLLGGCASMSRSGERPAWLGRVPEESGAIYFVGMSTRNKSLEEGRKAAMDDALERAVQYLGVKVSARYELAQNAIFSTVNSELETVSKGKLEGTHFKESYNEETLAADSRTKLFDVYVLLRYSKGEIDNARQLLAKENESAVKRSAEMLDAATVAVQDGRINDAFQSYSFALNAIDTTDDTTGLSNKILTSAAAVFSKMSIVRMNSPSSGDVSNGIKEALKVLVTYSPDGKQNIAAAEVPVRFSFRKGRGRLDSRSFTGHDGIASCVVSKIDSLLPDNSVEASVSFESLIRADLDKRLTKPVDTQKKCSPFVFASSGDASLIDPEMQDVSVGNFSNLTDEPALDWLSSGLSDVLANKLAGLKFINIVPLNASGRDGGQESHQLVVNGSYQKNKGTVKIVAKVSVLPEGRVFGTAQAEGRLDDIFSLQEELCVKVAGIINGGIAVNAGQLGSEKQPANIEAFEYFSKGVAAFRDKRFDDAVYLYKQAIGYDPSFSNAFNNLGLALARLSETEAAVAAFEKALALYPKNERPRVNLAITLYAAGNREKAVSVLGHLDTSNPYAAEGLNILGTIYNGMKLYDQAVSCFEKAVKLKPGSTDAHNGLGLALMNKGDITGAKTCFEKVITLDRKFAKAYNNLGVIADSEGKYDRAIYYLKTAVDIDTGDSAAWTNIGLVYTHKGVPNMALFAYEKAIEYNPGLPEAHINMAVFYAGIKEKELALQCLLKAKSLHYPGFANLKNEKVFGTISSDSRFQELFK